MPVQNLSLVVLYSPDIDSLRSFYERLGLQFHEEQHTAGPKHYAAVLGHVVMELYRAAVPQRGPVMIGFTVSHLGDILKSIEACSIYQPVQISESGRIAIVRDPDRRLVYLQER